MKAVEPGGASLALGESGQELGVHRFAHAAMATVFEVHCVHADPRYAGQAAEAAFDVVDRLEQDLSRFVANSDVSRINALGAGDTARVSPQTMACLELAVMMHAVTRQAFDISIGTGLERLELVPDSFAVLAREAGAQLDLGGIGKGFAVDRMAESLREWDVHIALVHGGFSSVLAGDAPHGRDGWPLTLSAPGGGEVLARVRARQLALSASGTRKGDHILDPRTGRPARRRAAWVALPFDGAGSLAAFVSPASIAEALSTAFMVLPVEEIEDLGRQCPGLETWLLEPVEEGPAEGALVHLAATDLAAG